MRTARQTAKTTARKSSARQDALTILKADHTTAKKLFDQYEKSKEKMSAEEKGDLVATICGELTVHTQIEEEIFYPAVRALQDEDLEELLDEAKVEHTGAKELIAQLADAAPDEPLYDARVTVLGEYIKHHAGEEENEMFPRLRKARELDLDELGDRLRQRAEPLKHEMGLD